jgi:predicted RNase H-related nuclease YkuK (DUF458 family)
MYNKPIDVLKVKEFIDSCGPETKIYLGCDSERIRVNDVWYADYIIAAVVHINGNNGCKIFGEVIRERDYDQIRNKPRMRLMNEVYKVAEMYLKLAEVIENDIEVHLDINPNQMYNSSIVINEAIGYIKGMCNVVPMIKPKAFAASYAADRYKSLAA